MKIADRMTLLQFPQYNPDDITRWNGMDKLKFKSSTFEKNIKSLSIDNSSLQAIHNWYNSLGLAMEMVHTEGIAILPKINLIKPGNTFDNLLLPPANYQTRQACKAFYNFLGQLLWTYLSKRATTKRASIARRAITLLNSSDHDGWVALMAIL